MLSARARASDRSIDALSGSGIPVGYRLGGRGALRTGPPVKQRFHRRGAAESGSVKITLRAGEGGERLLNAVSIALGVAVAGLPGKRAGVSSGGNLTSRGSATRPAACALAGVSILAALVLLALAATAGANHTLTNLQSVGTSGGNGAFDSNVDGFSDDGGHVFFDSQEALVPADTDTRVDVYDRFNGTTTLVSTGPTGGNGAFDAQYMDSSKDG